METTSACWSFRTTHDYLQTLTQLFIAEGNNTLIRFSEFCRGYVLHCTLSLKCAVKSPATRWRAVTFLSGTTLQSPGGESAGSAQLCSETRARALLSLCRTNSGSRSVPSTQEGTCPGLAMLSSVIYNCPSAWKANTLQTRDKLTCGSALTPCQKSFPP